MKKITLLLVYLIAQFGSYAQNKKKDLLQVITMNMDTFYFKKTHPNILGFWCTFPDGKGKRFKLKSLFSYQKISQAYIGPVKFGHKDTLTFEQRPMHPEDSKSSKQFLRVVLQNKEYKFLTFIPESSGYYLGYIARYIVKNDKFLVEVNKENHNKLIAKYFGDCEYLKKEVEHDTKNKYYDDPWYLTDLFNQHCR